MAVGQIVSANTLTAGIRADFADAYRQSYEGVAARLSSVMDLGIPSDKLTEIYAYFQSAPYPRLWTRGQGIPADAFGSVQFSVTNRDWAIRIEWHENDREDDLTRSLMERAREAGRNFATLPERIFFQLLLNDSSNTELLPAIPNAPDGAAMYATTDSGGSARFGITNGNLLTGTGIASSAAVRNDFFGAVEQMRGFQDTEGQPLWSDSILDRGFSVVFGVHNWQVFAEAFQQGRTLAAATTAQSNAAVTNIIMESGLNIDLWPTQRIPSSDDDFFVFSKGAPHKPVFQQMRRALRESYGNMDNSDSARETKIEHVQWDSREGYGLMLPYQTVKINN
tara:strand:- start:5374 stop:6384 length:1011 start_codon:yes stop_codon:yes gene_type:complete